VPVRLPVGVRQYVCPSTLCLRPYLPAEMLEASVWEHFASLNRAVADAIAPDKRRELLRTILRWVGIGDDIDDISYVWHD
jgi:hypothetical protein